MRQLGQWRPITLLTVFYKIISKSLALRLQPFMDEWLEKEQCGFVKGRSIADNLMMFKEAKAWAFSTGEKVTFLQLDFIKAFDRLEWYYLDVVLHSLGFGENFCTWVKILSADASSEVIVNDEVSEAFAVQRSVRQGCPHAPLLFVLVADVFIMMVKASPEFEGLDLPGRYSLRIMSYTDDNQLVICTTQAVLDCCACLIADYELLSSIAVNWIKSFVVCTKVLQSLPGLLAVVQVLRKEIPASI